MKNISSVFALFLCTGFASSATFLPPDTLQVISHNRIKVITDPSKGYNEFPAWALFPSPETPIRKITLFVTYQCPDSLHCGEWDYIDHIYLNRAGGSGSIRQNIEIARLISPYGWRFEQDWSFTWKVDVTDFSLLLRDSTEIVFNHNGYENNTDRGWVITCRFEVITGKPARELLGMDTLWQGFFPYGDSANSIENYLSPRTIKCGKGVTTASLRIIQTGHGMDDIENCAEFCSKYRQVIMDGQLADQRQIWQECGTNPLYPQAGTWIFDRANWCPGSMVQPHRIDLPVKPGSMHTLDIDMQPYVNPNHPSANYSFSTCVFCYATPRAKNDVEIEEIITPSTYDEFCRFNPVCMNPRLRMKNNGRKPLESVTLHYGFDPGELVSYKWQGTLASQQSAVVELPGVFPVSDTNQVFTVTLELPNNKKDEYPFDNFVSADVLPSPVYAAPFIFILKTNNESHQNAYRITDHEGRIIRERKLGSLASQTVYRDTLQLMPGCYEILVTDTAGDGLDFWFNPEGGFGYMRLLDMNGRLIKSFLSDFGSEIHHSLRVEENAVMIPSLEQLPIVEVFPPRNQGVFNIELFNNEPQDIFIKIFTADTSQIVFDRRYPGIKEGSLPVDLTSQPDGTYIIQVLTRTTPVMKKVRIRHDPSAPVQNFALIDPQDAPADIVRKAARVVPTRQQYAWQKNEFTAFIHFGLNTFTDREWGDGTGDPDLFFPSDFDARQWVKVIKEAGMRMLTLTVKHHDGFCLWPSYFTDYSVKHIPWRQGKADIVGEVASACQEAGIKFGIYLSPWDRHEPSYGNSPRYNEYFRNQLRELLTNYGEISEVWFDGACGEGPNGRQQVYDWLSYYRVIRELQPNAVIFGMGPDVRWVGTESGVGRDTEWSVVTDVIRSVDSIASSDPFPVDSLFIPGDRMAYDLGSREKILAAKTLYWYPSEADVSIRPSWFYHAGQDSLVRTPQQLVDLYFSSVGRNSVLLLNIPPDRRGLISDPDIQSLIGMRKILDRIFDTNLLAGAVIHASSEGKGHGPALLADGNPNTYWSADSTENSASVEIIFQEPQTFDVLMLQENIQTGQRIETFFLETFQDDQWQKTCEGTTVGYKRLLRFPSVSAGRIRLTIAQSRLNPQLVEIGLFSSQ